MDGALDVLEAEPRSVTFRGQRLQVRPLTIGQIPRLVRSCKPLIDSLLDLEAVPSDDRLVALLLELVGKHGEQAITAIAVATTSDEEWIRDGDPAEFVDLAAAVMEVNRDFFVQKLAPLLGGRAAMVLGGGPTPSSS